jgi:transcriptional regulator with XRE-family HTH domain
LSQEAVALAAGSTQGRISEIESGDNTSFGLALQIARALGWSPVELMRQIEKRETGR